MTEVLPSRQRAMSLPEFCQRYNIGRTKAYQQINGKRLKAHKCGKSTIISEDDAEDWLRNLPVIGAEPTADQRHSGKGGAEPTADQQQNGKRRKIAPQRRGSVSC